MEVAGTVLSAAQTLLAVLQNSDSQLHKFISKFGYKSQLEQLRSTVSAINAVLRDAEAKQEGLTFSEINTVEELKDVVYEADDLLDEFDTLAQQKAGFSLFIKLCRFFSKRGVARRMFKYSERVEHIREKLNNIASNTRFSITHGPDPEPIKRWRETCSKDDGDIIGREKDLEEIVGKICDPNVQREDLSFLTIVGIGGLGKTTLAQLVYNDPRVKSAFTLMRWACVSDQDQNQFDVKDILCKILESHDHSTLEGARKHLCNLLEGQKYLLVLDDVWSEDRDQWLKLKSFFVRGQRGSWILVTTRSHATADIMEDGTKHELKGLSEENSWHLFTRMAFGSQSSDPPHELVNIGQKIVERCAQVPLAIRVVGSLLYGQDKSQWLLVAQHPLASHKSQTNIMPILKLSYHHLDSPLKSCFSYCALFPKDYQIQKNKLISLWMAQGYIDPWACPSIDVAEKYFSILVQRCFFQFEDIREDTMYFKIHDLMHDVAQMVTKHEICPMDNLAGKLDNKVRHLSVTTKKVTRRSFDKSLIRTYLSFDYWSTDQHQLVKIKALMANCSRLRALDLSFRYIKTLPESIGELLHLRYLDLSWNRELEVLPKSITKLCNLQTLILSFCSSLKELPKELSRLVKLRTLLTDGCSKLTCFPKGMGKLSCLHRLSDFIVGGEGRDSSTKQWLEGLEDLKAMNNLRSLLNIKFKWPKNGVKVGYSRNAEHYLSNKEHLKGVTFCFRHQEEVDGGVDTEEATRFMEQLQPNLNLERLEVQGYRGVSMPGWITLLPKLVCIKLVDCKELEFMPPGLGKLQHLKELRLEKLPKLEYIEIIPSSFRSECAQGVSILPSLDFLGLEELPKLKALGDDLHLLEDNKYVQLHLTDMSIWNCPELTSIPLFLEVEILRLLNFNKRLTISSKSSSSICTIGAVIMDNVMWLKSLPEVVLLSIKSLSVSDVGGKLESFGELEEVFRICSSSLKTLCFSRCENLRSVCGGLEHLAALKNLEISGCPNVMLAEETEDGRPWRSLHHSLQTLTFDELPQLVSLPDWMQSLSALKYLRIENCKRLESLPDWMPKLTSLKRLWLKGCSESLESRCQKEPPGEDWRYIKLTPSISMLYVFASQN